MIANDQRKAVSALLLLAILCYGHMPALAAEADTTPTIPATSQQPGNISAEITTAPIPSEKTPAETTPPADTNTAPQKPGFLKRTLGKLERAHDEASIKYMSLSRAVDNYLANKKVEDADNDSYLRLDLQQTYYKAGVVQDDIHLNARIDLPGTEKRFKLIFSSNPEEDRSLGNRIEDTATGQHVQKQGSIAGVEYDSEAKPDEWKQSLTGGVRLRVSPVPFTRYRIGRDWLLPDNWKFDLRQSLWYFEDKGTGATLEMPLSNQWSVKDIFAITPDIEYHHREETTYYGLTFANTHRITQESSIVYRTGVLGESRPTTEITSYFVGTQYRRLLYKKWLFINLTPQLSFPRTENWHMQPSFTATLQVYFQ